MEIDQGDTLELVDRVRPTGLLIATVLLALVALPALSAEAKKPKKANLKVVKVSDAPAGLMTGDSFTTTGKIQNKGKKGARNPKLKLILKGSGVKDLKVGTAQFEGKVVPSQKQAFSIDGAVPDSLADGSYKLSACVKRGGETGKWACKKAKGSIAVTATPPVDYQPGSKSLGDDLFPQIGNGGYDADHYAIDLRYAPNTNKFLTGTKTTITATATQNLSEFSFDFQDMNVTSVTVDGQPADFVQADAEPNFPDNATQPMKLTISPAEGIDDGDEFTTVVAYDGTPGQITDADDSYEGWIPACYPLTPPQTCDGAFVVNEPIGAQGWFPNNNHPSDKATFETKVTVPEPYTALGVGELDSNTVNANGNRTWVWSEDDPTATYLTTATVGLFDYTEDTMTEATTGHQLDIYNAVDASATQPQKDLIASRMALQPGMLNFLSDVLGPYPFDSTGVVADKASGVGYALEVQTKSHFAGGYSSGNPSVGESTLLHEISHQWMGDSISTAMWKDIWFNEGYATFFEYYYDSEVHAGDPPSVLFDDIYNDAGYDWTLAPAELDNDPANLFTSPTYDRAGAMLAGFYEIVGENRFFAFARQLQSRYGYGNITTAQYIADAVAASGYSGAEADLLEDYFQQWLYGTVQPTLTPADF